MLAPLLAVAVRAYCVTIRIHDNSRSARVRRQRRPHIMVALWHSHQFAALWHYRRLGVVLLSSWHHDAEYSSRTARSLGYRIVRGSSTRGATRAYLELARLTRAGKSIALTCDGPHGPPHVVKAGVVHLAQQGGVPLLPFAMGLSSFWTMRSWDGFRVPKPFSHGYALLGEPLWVPPEATREELEAATLEVQRRLLELEPLADRLAREQSRRAR